MRRLNRFASRNQDADQNSGYHHQNAAQPNQFDWHMCLLAKQHLLGSQLSELHQPGEIVEAGPLREGIQD